MKKSEIVWVLAFIIATLTGKAQSFVVSPERFFGSEYNQIGMRNIMELRDGSVLANVQLFEWEQGDYGCVFYKIVYDSVSVHVSDTLFIEDHDMNYFLLERNPLDNDNVFAKIVCNYTSVRSDLRIQFFDDDLNFKPEKEIWVPISDTLISPLADYYMLDNNGDLLFRYKIQSRKEFHVVKMGLDGTEKAHLVLPTDNDMVNRGFKIATFNESPKEYCIMGLYSPSTPYPYSGDDSLRFIILDSLLNIERTITHNTPPNKRRFLYGWDNFQSLEDTSFFVLTKYDTVWCLADNDTCYQSQIVHERIDGTCLSKCGKSNGRNNASRLYSVFSYPMDVKKTNDGNIYIAFYNTSSVTVAKLTQNMEVLWETNYNNGVQYFTNMVALENGGVAVGGLNDYYSEDYSSYTQGLFFVIFKDETFSVTENKTEERPYTLYPNPAGDELNMNIAHDAEEVSLIELYDIQGRMVRSQHSNFGKISLKGLHVGTYALRVSLKNGKTFTSTVIKK